MLGLRELLGEREERLGGGEPIAPVGERQGLLERGPFEQARELLLPLGRRDPVGNGAMP